MKILFVLPRMVTGGVERVTLRLVAGLQARGHECAFALRRAYGEFLPEAEALCPVHEVAAGGMQQFVPNLAQLIRTWQPTHIVTAFADVGVFTHMAIKRSGRQVFWAHGVHGTHDPITAKPGLMERLRFTLDQYFAAWVYRHCHVVVAVSDGVRADILQKFTCPAERVVTIFNPVLDASQLRPRADLPFAHNSVPRLLALGRLTRQKGFDILIEAMQWVPQPWQLDIWGDGEERQALQNLIVAKGLQAHIKLRGNTHQPLEVMRQADVFVMPSRWEGFGLVLVEALASGCQVVATDCPHGPSEILQGGRYGVLVENKNPHKLAHAINQALQREHTFNASELLQMAGDFSVNSAVYKWTKVLESKNESFN